MRQNTGWTTIPLHELCEIQIGRTPARNVPRYWGHGNPWLSITDMNQGRILLTTREKITDTAVQECNCRLIQKGTVLLSFKLSIGKVRFAGIPLYSNEAIAALPIKKPDLLIEQYLYWALRQIDFDRFVDKAAKGKTLNKAKLRQVAIPVPPLDEQKRIATILDKADELRDKRRLLIERLDVLAQSIFLEMFGDPATNPKEWPQKRISEIGKVITGNTPPRSNVENYGSAIEWIKSDNINTPHYYVTTADEGLSQTGKSIARIAPPGSILVTCIAGTPDCIGNAAMTDREVAFNQQINAFIPDSGDPHFYYAQILIGKRLIQRASTASMKGMVSKGRFEQIRLVVPPLELQNKFAQRLLELEKVKGMNHTSLAKMDDFFASLQYRAFSGTL